MGFLSKFFKSKTTITVSSTVYSMSGDETEVKEDYLKSNLFSAVTLSDGYVGESVVNNYLSGPGIQQRRFFSWAKNNNYSGLPEFSTSNSYSVDPLIVSEQIAILEDLDPLIVEVSSAEITDGDYTDFAEQYVLENNPGLYNTDWFSDYDPLTQTIIIQFVDGSTVDVEASSYDDNSQYIVANYKQSGTDKIYIYKLGSGVSELDNLRDDEESERTVEFYPFIPIRLNNNSITNNTFVENGLFSEAEKAYERFYNQSTFVSLVESIEDNDNIGDIDYAYVCFGVPLNTDDYSGKRYVYEFFKNMIPHQTSGTTTIRINTNNISSFDVRLSWTDIEEDIFNGLISTDTKRGDVVLQTSGSQDLIISYQITDTHYSRLFIRSLVHRNFIYKGKYVSINSHEALADDDISGFLVPLHQPTVQKMSIVHSTQLSTNNGYIVFNSYDVVKQKWYQTGIFKLFVVIASIVLAVVTSGGSLALTAGILGTNIAVGAALGLSGIAAVIAGAVANALAAIIIVKLINTASTKLFGDQIGSIIGAVLSFVTITAASGGFSNLDFSTFANPEGILKLSNVLSNSYNGWVQSNIADINEDIANSTTEYEKTLENINDLIKGLGGTNDLSFNPLTLTNINTGNGQGLGSFLPESLDGFIQRTTMVGSDVVNITISMITDYPELSLQLPKN